MKVTAENTDYSNPVKSQIKVHNAWGDSSKVELEVNGERYTVNAEELISAIKRCTLNCFGNWQTLYCMLLYTYDWDNLKRDGVHTAVKIICDKCGDIVGECSVYKIYSFSKGKVVMLCSFCQREHDKAIKKADESFFRKK